MIEVKTLLDRFDAILDSEQTDEFSDVAKENWLNDAQREIFERLVSGQKIYEVPGMNAFFHSSLPLAIQSSRLTRYISGEMKEVGKIRFTSLAEGLDGRDLRCLYGLRLRPIGSETPFRGVSYKMPTEISASLGSSLYGPTCTNPWVSVLDGDFLGIYPNDKKYEYELTGVVYPTDITVRTDRGSELPVEFTEELALRAALRGAISIGEDGITAQIKALLLEDDKKVKLAS